MSELLSGEDKQSTTEVAIEREKKISEVALAFPVEICHVAERKREKKIEEVAFAFSGGDLRCRAVAFDG
ncbi:hypothetical protein ISN45_Aa07g008630 [Arabidopsis thaliana x Arabidopsis arenosa]|uniref:Uncharacterized protein n=1 Tax=Arabidopsis thaliana x Arabidopsis arenosa TaxID=1240361 RepID=A0A8T1Y059_9BRAS|nr:hypothetical protein ISN45_Aa07g008620 [Arabidopsis thaliana x Arabidopsis arenosa]KAG7540693.1 hypothetical protein ISN45_Aa07g008630 [Arabidopsis thaliana x Arabidopsis arenosa]